VPPGFGETQAIGTAGGRAFYGSYTYWASGYDLRFWVTDGNPEGTELLTPQRHPVWWQAAAGGPGLFFTTCERNVGCSFWSSDGTLEGTAQRGALSSGGAEIELLGLVALKQVGLQLIRKGDRVDLLAIDPAGGIKSLRRFRAPVRPRLLTAVGLRAFFLAPVAGRLQLWTSDGTSGGTRALTQFAGARAFETTHFLQPIGDSVYFIADDGKHGVELWANDGTPGGSRRLTDLAPARPFDVGYREDPGLGAMIGRLGNLIVFPADAGHGSRLWTTRGTLASTHPLTGCPAGCPEAGTTYFAPIKNRLVFAASDRQHGRELWTTDGTGRGTHLVADLTPGPSSQRLRFFTKVGQLVVFPGSAIVS
jgi:ELWxxDGT repeat protein